MTLNLTTLDHVSQAIEAVLALDLPDECWPDALADHAVLLAGTGPDDATADTTH